MPEHIIDGKRYLEDAVCSHCGCRDAKPTPTQWVCALCNESWQPTLILKLAVVQTL
jgi:hypothetical protein